MPACTQALDKMVAEWDGAELQVMPYRETGTYIIKVGACVLPWLRLRMMEQSACE